MWWELSGIESLAAESVIRAIAYVLGAKYYNWTNEKTLDEIENHYVKGLALIPFFFDELKRMKTPK